MEYKPGREDGLNTPVFVEKLFDEIDALFEACELRDNYDVNGCRHTTMALGPEEIKPLENIFVNNFLDVPGWLELTLRGRNPKQYPGELDIAEIYVETFSWDKEGEYYVLYMMSMTGPGVLKYDTKRVAKVQPLNERTKKHGIPPNPRFSGESIGRERPICDEEKRALIGIVDQLRRYCA